MPTGRAAGRPDKLARGGSAAGLKGFAGFRNMKRKSSRRSGR